MSEKCQFSIRMFGRCVFCENESGQDSGKTHVTLIQEMNAQCAVSVPELPLNLLTVTEKSA